MSSINLLTHAPQKVSFTFFSFVKDIKFKLRHAFYRLICHCKLLYSIKARPVVGSWCGVSIIMCKELLEFPSARTGNLPIPTVANMGRLPLTPKKRLDHRAQKSWRPYDKPFPCTGTGKLAVLNAVNTDRLALTASLPADR